MKTNRTHKLALHRESLLRLDLTRADRARGGDLPPLSYTCKTCRCPLNTFDAICLLDSRRPCFD